MKLNETMKIIKIDTPEGREFIKDILCHGVNAYNKNTFDAIQIGSNPHDIIPISDFIFCTIFNASFNAASYNFEDYNCGRIPSPEVLKERRDKFIDYIISEYINVVNKKNER